MGLSTILVSFINIQDVMPNFSREDVGHLKRLCRMECSEEEEREFVESIQKVLSYMAQLQEIDTSNVIPCSDVHRSMLKNQTRPDVVKELLSREEFLANAPDQIGGMVRVPPVLKSP